MNCEATWTRSRCEFAEADALADVLPPLPVCLADRAPLAALRVVPVQAAPSVAARWPLRINHDATTIKARAVPALFMKTRCHRGKHASESRPSARQDPWTSDVNGGRAETPRPHGAVSFAALWHGPRTLPPREKRDNETVTRLFVVIGQRHLRDSARVQPARGFHNHPVQYPPVCATPRRR
jgi:hypothetical protein